MRRNGVRAVAQLTRHPWRVMIFGVGILTLAVLLQPAVDGQNPPMPPLPSDPAPAAANPLDGPIAWLTEAKRNYPAVKDYACTLVSRERVNGVLQDESVIAFKARPQPFSVHMKWLAPRKSANQEVAFVMGRNGNKMRVKGHGISKIAGFVSIDPTDPRVTEHSRHTIYEAGLGNLIDQTLKHWAVERQVGKSVVKTAEYNYDNRACLRIETTRTERRPEFYCYRSVLYLDKDSKIPVRTENYDWPRPGGNPEGELLELFSYVGLRFNVGLTDADFSR